MRQGRASLAVLAAVLLLLGAPTALAQRSTGREIAGVPVGMLGLVLMGLGGALLFLLSVSAARKAQRPKVRPAPKRSFEHGREMGRLAGVASEQDALRALGESPVAKLVSVTPVPHGYRVALSRKRSEPCAVAAGYVTGLFESAWARDVILRHDACQGKAKNAVCVYEVRDPAPRRAGPAPKSDVASFDPARRSPPGRGRAGGV